MKWILVYIAINNGVPIAVNGAGPNYYYNTMTECFWAREKLQKDTEKYVFICFFLGFSCFFLGF